MARREQKYAVNIKQECYKQFHSQEKENREPEQMSGAQGGSSLAPLANQQVASMRRELEAEQETRGQHRASSPGGGARYAPQMGYAQAHGEWREEGGVMTRIITSCACSQPLLEDFSLTRSRMSRHCRVRDPP